MPKSYTPVLALPRPGSGADLVSEGDDIIRELTDRLDAIVGPPAGAAGGDLGGSYPNPSVVTINGKAVSAVVFNTDARLTDARAPTGAASGDLDGTYPNPSVAKVNGRAATSVVFTDDPRLSDARSSTVPLVTALPANPTDGQEIAYNLGAVMGGSHWRFRYMTAVPVGAGSTWNPGQRHWMFLGGAPLTGGYSANGVGGVQSVPSGGATPTEVGGEGTGAEVTIPLAGDYLVEWGLMLTGWTGTTVAYQVGLYDHNAPGTFLSLFSNNIAPPITINKVTRVTQLPAGAVLTVGYHQTTGGTATATGDSVFLRVTPLHV